MDPFDDWSDIEYVSSEDDASSDDSYESSDDGIYEYESDHWSSYDESDFVDDLSTHDFEESDTDSLFYPSLEPIEYIKYLFKEVDFFWSFRYPPIYDFLPSEDENEYFV